MEVILSGSNIHMPFNCRAIFRRRRRRKIRSFFFLSFTITVRENCSCALLKALESRNSMSSVKSGLVFRKFSSQRSDRLRPHPTQRLPRKSRGFFDFLNTSQPQCVRSIQRNRWFCMQRRLDIIVIIPPTLS